MSKYNQDKLNSNLAHELIKMLIAMYAIYNEKINIPVTRSRVSSPNGRIEFYLKFSLALREEMAKKLGISEKTLYRIFEEPVRILNDFDSLNKLANFFSLTYPEIIQKVFNYDPNSFKSKDSTLLGQLEQLEKQLGVEKRREISYVLSFVSTRKIPIDEFINLNNKMIKNKCYSEDKFLKISHFLESL